MRFRCDKSEVNEHGQIVWHAQWMGGPSVSKVVGAVCADGKRRTATVTGHADTWFSLPAIVSVKGKTVTGFLSTDNGLWHFTANKYRKNHALIVPQEKPDV